MYPPTEKACGKYEPADGSMPDWALKTRTSPQQEEPDTTLARKVGRRLRFLPMRGRRTLMTATISPRSIHANNIAWRAIGNPQRVFVEADPVAGVLLLIAGDGPDSFKVTKSGCIIAPALIQTLAKYGFDRGRYRVTAVDGKELHLRREPVQGQEPRR